MKATVFGDARRALLAEAKSAHRGDPPDRYLNHVWGENEVGGTSVLYVSDVEPGDGGLARCVSGRTLTRRLTRPALHVSPAGRSLGVGAAAFGLAWIIRPPPAARLAGGRGALARA